MQKFIGTKIIQAQEMTRAEYNDYRGWELPADEDGADAGYLVEYLDGGKANHHDHAGYISWSPADVFARAYRHTAGMTFGQAVEALKAGQRVARAGWNGKGMWLIRIAPYEYEVESYTLFDAASLLPYIAMRTADACMVPWIASQTDMLAEDWAVI